MDRTEAATAVVPDLAHWLAPADVAARLGVGHLVVLGWITQGLSIDVGRRRLPAKKVGGRWKIDPAQVAAFVDAMTRDALGEGADVAPPPEPASRDRRRVRESMARLRAAGVVS